MDWPCGGIRDEQGGIAMTFGRFLWLLLVRPRQAFEEGKGRFLPASILFGIFSGISTMYLLRLFVGQQLPVNMFLTTILGLISFLAFSLVLHRISLHYSEGNATWREFLSLFGFTFVPTLLVDLLSTGILVLHLADMRSPNYPGLISYGTGWLIVIGGFSIAMEIASYIYQALVVRVVHHLPWKLVVTTIVIGALIQSILISPNINSNIHLAKLPWETSALMIDNVNKIDISPMMCFSVELHHPLLQIGELVLVGIKGITINGRDNSDVVPKSDQVLTEIMAGPGETVELRQGSLWVNDKLVREVEPPLPHLTLVTSKLLPDQYFVYFRSPAALGESFSPDKLIVSHSQISSAVPDSTLGYLQWMLR